jgi:hypothetical protein
MQCMPRHTKRRLHTLYERQQRRQRKRNVKELVDWLIKHEGSPPYRRLLRIIEDFRELRDATPPLGTHEFLLREWSQQPESDFPWEKVRRLNALLLTYKTCVQVVGHKTVVGSSMQRLAHRSRLTFDWFYVKKPEAEMVHRLVEIEKMELFERVRQCKQCRKWLFAEKNHQLFCSRECRQKHFRTSEEGRKKRKEYMRRYRASPARQAGRRR